MEPENCGGRWLGQAAGPAAGARFVGRNRKGPLRWSTVCTVTAADPGHVFAFTVKALGLTVSQWSYVFEDAEGGCVVTERWTDRRPAAARSLGDLVMGVRDRGEHNSCRYSHDTRQREIDGGVRQRVNARP